MKRFSRLRNRKGVALLITIGILAVMSIIATSFSFSMKLEMETAVNFTRSVKALYTAQSGVNKVIADIRSQVTSSTYSNLISYINSYSTSEQTLGSQGTYQITIGSGSNKGEDQKVNLNALDDTDAIWIGRLQTLGLTYDDIAKIIDYRDPDSDVTSQLYTTGGWFSCTGNETNTKNSNFTSTEEVKLIVGDTKYNNIKNDVTIYGSIIRGGLLAEYYDSISGSSPNVQINRSSFVGKIIEPGEVCEPYWLNSVPFFPGADGEWWSWRETNDVPWAGGYLLTGPTAGSRIDTFGVIFEGYIEVLPNEVGSAVTFYMRNDDGARLYIDGTQVLSAWYDKQMDPETSGTYTFNYPGWHPIKIEYYDNGWGNGCELTWSLAGANDPDSAGDVVPAERLGFPPIITHPKETSISYPSAGIYSITSIGKVKATDGSVLSEKRVTSVVKTFGVWTQTTREDFYAPWVSDPGNIWGATEPYQYYEGNYRDGHIFNVNWLNSCPDNASADLEAGGYTTTVNALKLGYWDDFDEDSAYSVMNLMAMGKVVIEGPNIQKKWASYGSDWWWANYWERYNDAGAGYFAMDYSQIETSGGNTRVAINTAAFTEYWFEINYNFYRPGTNVFARAWTSSSASPSSRIGWRGDTSIAPIPSSAWSKVKYFSSGGDSYYYYDITNPPGENPSDPRPVYNVYQVSDGSTVKIYGNNPPYLEDSYSASGAYRQPLTYYVTPFLYARGERRKPPPDTLKLDTSGVGHYTVLNDGDGWTFRDGDRLEINTMNGQVARTDLSPGAYDPTNVLAMIKGSSSNAYKAYLDGGAKTAEVTPNASPEVANFKFKSNNTYDMSWYRYQAIWMRGAPLDAVTHYYDNIRFIPDSGILVSTPFDPGESVTWGRVSWTEKNPADATLDVAISLRTASSKSALPSDDTGWTSYSNGAQITNTGRWLQYKATLTTTALNKDSYANSGKTPIFQDITITYLPRVEVLYYREITE